MSRYVNIYFIGCYGTSLLRSLQAQPLGLPESANKGTEKENTLECRATLLNRVEWSFDNKKFLVDDEGVNKKIISHI